MKENNVFNPKVWWRAFTFKRKTDGINNLKLKCPICKSEMIRFKNYGLNIEERLFSVCPYYCKVCSKERSDYPIYNVGWRSEEAKAPIYMAVIFVIFTLGIIIIRSLI